MSRRKGEITTAQVDRDYPHQVEIHADVCVGRARGHEIEQFIRPLSIAPIRGRRSFQKDGHWLRFAFVSAADADAFQREFGGRRLTVTTIRGRPPLDSFLNPADEAASRAGREGTFFELPY